MPLLAVLVVLLGSPQSAPAEGQSLRGIVRDQTGPVLENARLELYDEAHTKFFGRAIAARPPRHLQLSTGFRF